MQKELTDRKFWTTYWKNKNEIQLIRENFSFHALFRKFLKNKLYKNMIEIGGYPGHYAIYFKKYWNFNTTLLDYVVNSRIITKALKLNDLGAQDLEIIKTDFFKYRSTKKYDLVFSLGFIEHFYDTQEVIKRHWELVNKNGTMILGIPNFLGLNGIYQLLFDPSNLNIHNLDSMKIPTLKKIISNLKPRQFSIFYVSGGIVWLEKITSRHPMLLIFTYGINLVGLFLARIGIKNKLISTHIFIVAEK